MINQLIVEFYILSPTVELQYGTKAIASATFIYDPLFYASGFVCRQDARIGLSRVEE